MTCDPRRAALVLALAIGLSACWAPRGAYAERPLPRSSVDHIVVYKARAIMEVYSGRRLLKSYRVALGSGGAGPKRYEGDKRTPVGRYIIDGRHHSRRFHRFLHISYPNAADRARYRRLRARGAVPVRRGIGSAIGIHGESRRWRWFPHKWKNWTHGCIAVDDAEIVELYAAVRPRATIIIRP